jgi:hypothetical protein
MEVEYATAWTMEGEAIDGKDGWRSRRGRLQVESRREADRCCYADLIVAAC